MVVSRIVAPRDDALLVKEEWLGATFDSEAVDIGGVASRRPLPIRVASVKIFAVSPGHADGHSDRVCKGHGEDADVDCYKVKRVAEEHRV